MGRTKPEAGPTVPSRSQAQCDWASLYQRSGPRGACTSCPARAHNNGCPSQRMRGRSSSSTAASSASRRTRAIWATSGRRGGPWPVPSRRVGDIEAAPTSRASRMRRSELGLDHQQPLIGDPRASCRSAPSRPSRSGTTTSLRRAGLELTQIILTLQEGVLESERSGSGHQDVARRRGAVHRRARLRRAGSAAGGATHLDRPEGRALANRPRGVRRKTERTWCDAWTRSRRGGRTSSASLSRSGYIAAIVASP
jgi:hypothetical protein